LPCEGLDTFKVSSLVGNWNIRVCPKGLHLIKLDEEVTNENFLQQGSKEVKIIQDSKSPYVQDVYKWFQSYFEGQEQRVDLKICNEIADQNSQNFRQKVWLTLKDKVTFGQTVSYGELANLSGHPGAFQAVGSAMSNNPISLVIPCHRVVKSDGSTGNYSKATKNDVKKWLLKHESHYP